MDINYFKAIQGAIGADNAQEVLIRQTKENLSAGMLTSIGNARVKRNGEYQNFVVSQTTVRYKYQITAYPDEELYVGDIIDYMNEKWIITETRVGSPLQKTGIMWLCNINLSFQNGTHDIITRPAVLDSGVYSTTKNGNEELQYVDKQFKLYLPYDDDTKKIYVDKRIAVDTRFDKHGQEILEVYSVTGLNRVARSYGKGGHLLVCELRSDTYSPSADNLELMICDYIADNDSGSSATELLPCSISGRPTIMLGQTRTYTATFYNAENQEVSGIESVWDIIGNVEVTTQQADNTIKITVPDNEDYIGETMQVILTDTNGLYKPFTFEVEVVA